MKVVGVQTYLVRPAWGEEGAAAQPTRGKHWLFVKVETDEGIAGWGEAYTQTDRERAVEAHVLSLRRYLIGRDPFAIKHFTTQAYLDFSYKRGSMELYSAVSALEQALWDIVGKATGQPVYNLLGGPCRGRVRVYANGWYDGCQTPEDFALRAKAVLKRGFTALKFDPFPGPWRMFISPLDEDTAVERVEAVREMVGPGVEILIEVHRRLAPMTAMRVARRLEPFRPFWFEEPVSPENLDALAQVRRLCTLPIVTGEALYAKAMFREALEKGAADILNPDVANCGGILELKEIAAMAEPYYVAVAPHNYNSTTIALAATLQVSALIPNFLITEYFVNYQPAGEAICREPLRLEEGGYISLPKRPGLGLELEEEALSQYPYQEFPPRTLREFGQESP